MAVRAMIFPTDETPVLHLEFNKKLRMNAHRHGPWAQAVPGVHPRPLMTPVLRSPKGNNVNSRRRNLRVRGPAKKQPCRGCTLGG